MCVCSREGETSRNGTIGGGVGGGVDRLFKKNVLSTLEVVLLLDGRTGSWK